MEFLFKKETPPDNQGGINHDSVLYALFERLDAIVELLEALNDKAAHTSLSSSSEEGQDIGV